MAAAALSVPKKFYFEVPGVPNFDLKSSSQTTPGVEQILIDHIIPSGQTCILYQAVVVCRMESRFSVFVDAELIGSGRTGAAKPTDIFSWLPGLPVESGHRIRLLFTARRHSAPADVEVYLQTSVMT